MAKQKGIVKLGGGSIGDINFMQTKDGFIARAKGGVDGSRIKNDPRFVRTRENGSEFSRAGKATKLLRKSFRTLMLGVADGRSTSRIMKLMMKAIHADTVSARGARSVSAGEPGFLKGFEFNINAPLETTFVAPYTATINRVTGETVINVPAFNPSQFVVPPQGATHCRIVSAGVLVDFDGDVHVSTTSRSQDIDLKAVQQPQINHLNAVTANGKAPIFVALGIDFFQKVNGVLYPLSNGAFNALAIVAVDGKVA